MKLYDIELTDSLLQTHRKIKVDVPADARRYVCYSNAFDGNIYNGITYISDNDKNKNRKTLTVYLHEIGDEVENEHAIFLGVLNSYGIHVSISE